jgi:hypothetical protein
LQKDFSETMENSNFSTPPKDAYGRESRPFMAITDAADELDWARKTIELWQQAFDTQAFAAQGTIHYLANRNSVDEVDITAQSLLILGDWWQGSRRYVKFPDQVTQLYWFEIYKIVGKLDSSVCRPTRLSLVLSDDSEVRSAAIGALERFAVASIGQSTSASLPNASPQLVLVHFTPASQLETNVEVIKRLRIAYPSSLIAILDGFPRWETSSGWLTAGANLVCGMPYDLSALLKFAILFSSAALPRK